MRIWHQSAAPLSGMGPYAEALDAHIRRVVSPGTEVVLHGLSRDAYAGRPPARVLKYPYLRHLILGEVIEGCIRAEREGFDAIALASYNDPFVREARSVVDIPIVSMAESTLFLGSTLASRLGLVTLTRANVPRLREIVERHGLEEHVATILPLDPETTEAELMEAFSDPAPLLEIFSTTAERAAEAGAELLIPAEGVLNEVLFAHGVSSLHDLPVLDCVGTVFLHAELRVHLAERTGLRVGRRGSTEKPEAELLAQVRAAHGLEP